MSEDIRRMALRQGAQTVAGFVSSRIRNRTTTIKVDVPEPPDRPALKAAEELVGRRPHLEGTETTEEEVLETGRMLIPQGLFATIEDRVEAKAALSDALASERPVHVLLVGDPGCGKTELLRCITTLPNSRYATGGNTTSSGLVGYLLERPSTRVVVIDELDKSDKADLYALYTLMQSGVVTRLQHQAHEEVRRDVWVFAGANKVDQLPEALISRFVVVRIPSYTPDQMREITAAILVKREGVEPARAKEIASAVALRSKDPRDGIQIARMAGATTPIGPIVERVIPRGTKNGAQT